MLAAAIATGSPAAAQGTVEAAGGGLPHVLLSAGVGGQLRLGTDDTFDQDATPPIYADVMLGFTMPVEGFDLGISIDGSVNLQSDGGYTEPVFVYQQWSLTPALLLYHDWGRDWLALVRLGPTFVFVGPTDLPDSSSEGVSLGSAGGELGITGAHRWLAGLLTYAEINLDMWVGEGGSRHWTAALELGLLLDYEVLP